MINYVVSASDFNSLLPKVIAAFEAFGGRRNTLPSILLTGESSLKIVDHNSLYILEDLLSKIYTNLKDRPNQYFPSAQYNKLTINPKWRVKLIFSHDTDDYIKQPRFDRFTFSDGTKNITGSEAADFIGNIPNLCPCNCNYSCTCQCNYCSCNCNYSCTCQCNYTFWDAPSPSCSCHCNYSCTCNCNYTTYWTTTETYTEEHCLDSHVTYTDTVQTSPGCNDEYHPAAPTYDTVIKCYDLHVTYDVTKTREVPHSSYDADSTGPAVVHGSNGQSIFRKGSDLSTSVVIGRPGPNKEEPVGMSSYGSKPDMNLSTFSDVPESFSFYYISTARTGQSRDYHPTIKISDDRYYRARSNSVRYSCRFHGVNVQNEANRYTSTLRQYYNISNWKPEVILSKYVCCSHSETSTCGAHMHSSHSGFYQWRSASKTKISKEGWPTD